MVKINISSSQNEKKQLQGSSTLIFCIHRDRLPVTVLCIWSASFAVSSGKLYLLQEKKIPPLVGKCVGFSSPSCQLCALYPTAFLRTFLAPVQDVIYVHHTAQLLLLLVLSNFSQKHYHIFLFSSWILSYFTDAYYYFNPFINTIMAFHEIWFL